MRRVFIFSFFIFVFFHTTAQRNIVVNASFESGLNQKIDRFSRKKNGERLVYGWSVPTSGTPDYYDYNGSRVFLNRLVKARTDSGRVALITGIGRRKIRELFKYPKGYAEYIQGSFARPLETGQLYCVSFYTAQHPDAKYSVNAMGAYISSTPVNHRSDGAPLLLRPQVTAKKFITPDQHWYEVTGSYKAQGGERYITIGNWGIPNIQKTKKITGERHHKYSVFNTAAYYFIDDVSVKKSTPSASCTQEKTKRIELPKETHYLFLLDVSGSMKGKHYIDSVQANLPGALQNLHSDSKVSLLSFSNDVISQFEYQPPTQIVSDSAFWSNLETGGITSYRDAIEKAYQMVDTSSYYETTIVLISDGEFKVKESMVELVQKNYRQNGTHFSIMMMGNQLIPGDMMRLSTLSEGRGVKFEENDFNDLILDRGYKVLPGNMTALSEKHSPLMAFIGRSFRPLMIGVVLTVLYFSIR